MLQQKQKLRTFVFQLLRTPLLFGGQQCRRLAKIIIKQLQSNFPDWSAAIRVFLPSRFEHARELQVSRPPGPPWEVTLPGNFWPSPIPISREECEADGASLQRGCWTSPWRYFGKTSAAFGTCVAQTRWKNACGNREKVATRSMQKSGPSSPLFRFVSRNQAVCAEITRLSVDLLFVLNGRVYEVVNRVSTMFSRHVVAVVSSPLVNWLFQLTRRRTPSFPTLRRCGPRSCTSSAPATRAFRLRHLPRPAHLLPKGKHCVCGVGGGGVGWVGV